MAPLRKAACEDNPKSGIFPGAGVSAARSFDGADNDLIAPALAAAPSRSLATAATAFFGYFVVALLLMHALRPDYMVTDHMMSDHAVGRFDWVMTTTFLSLALGCFTLAIGLFLDGQDHGWGESALRCWWLPLPDSS